MVLCRPDHEEDSETRLQSIHRSWLARFQCRFNFRGFPLSLWSQFGCTTTLDDKTFFLQLLHNSIDFHNIRIAFSIVPAQYARGFPLADARIVKHGHQKALAIDRFGFVAISTLGCRDVTCQDCGNRPTFRVLDEF